MPRRTRYEVAREAGRETLRDAVLDAAAELVALEGPSALTMRRLADHIGASTTVLYNLFDGKNGIIDAIVRSGHQVLRRRLDAISADSPMERLAATGRVYREVALEDPARYQLMFGNSMPGYQPSESARAAARASFGALQAAVQECIDAGILKSDVDAEFAAEVLTAAAHGAVSLELSGHYDATRADERFSALLAAAVQPLLAPPEPSRAPGRTRTKTPRK